MTDNKKLTAFMKRVNTLLHEPLATVVAEEWAEKFVQEFPVFDEALTPTNDEREALIALLSVGVDEIQTEADMADAILAAGFRRSEVPEPSTEEKIEWPDHWTTNEKLRDLHARWHDQKGNLLGREACGWEGCEFWDSAQFTLRLADVKIAGQEPQGEPSDAQEAVDRLDQCLTNRDAGVGAWSMVRPEDVRTVLAALRAAGGVR